MVTEPTIDNVKEYIIAELESAREGKDNNYINPYVVADNVFYLLSKKYIIKEKDDE